MKNGSEYHYPSSDAYTEKLYSDEGITGLSQNSQIIRLLEELEKRETALVARGTRLMPCSTMSPQRKRLRPT